MPIHHLINTTGHAAISTIKPGHINLNVNIASIMLGTHVGHFSDQRIQRVDTLVQVVFNRIEITIVMICDLGWDMAF